MRCGDIDHRGTCGVLRTGRVGSTGGISTVDIVAGCDAWLSRRGSDIVRVGMALYVGRDHWPVHGTCACALAYDAYDEWRGTGAESRRGRLCIEVHGVVCDVRAPVCGGVGARVVACGGRWGVLYSVCGELRYTSECVYRCVR